MARIRSIHPGWFTDDAVVSLSFPARVLLIGIWTEADDHGVFEWKPVTLKMRVMPVDNVSVPDLLEECLSAEVIRKFLDGKYYGLVRNFCRYQRPKKPKYVHPMPAELRTYAGLNRDGSLPVLRHSGSGTEKSPQREEEGGRRDLEREDEMGEGGDLARPPAKIRNGMEKGESAGSMLTIDWQPTDETRQKIRDAGFGDVQFNAEFSKFVPYYMKLGKRYENWDAALLSWFSRTAPDPNLPGPAAGMAMVGRVFVIKGTLAWNCHVDHIRRTQRGRAWTMTIKHVDADGREQEGWWWSTEFPEGYDQATGAYMAGKEETAA